MRFFLSSEADIAVSDALSLVQNPIQARLNEYFVDREYGATVKMIAVIPMILRPEWQAGHRERRLFQRKKESADYRTWIDFEKMRAGPDKLRELLVLKNIVEAVKDLSRKARTGFDGAKLVDDILCLFGVTQSELDAA